MRKKVSIRGSLLGKIERRKVFRDVWKQGLYCLKTEEVSI